MVSLMTKLTNETLITTASDLLEKYIVGRVMTYGLDGARMTAQLSQGWKRIRYIINCSSIS